MYLGYIWLTVAAFVVIGGIFGGGTFTIVLVPVGIIAAVLAVGPHAFAVRRMWGPGSRDPEKIRLRAGREQRKRTEGGPQNPDEFINERQHQQ